MKYQYLGAGHSKSSPVVTEGCEVDLLLDRFVHDLGHLHLGHLGGGHRHGGIRVGGVRVVSVRVSGVGERQSGVGEGRSGDGLDLSLLISRPLASGLALGQAGHGETEDVGTASLLDAVGYVLHRHLHLLDDGLDDVRGVGEGGAQGVRVAKPGIELSRACYD